MSWNDAHRYRAALRRAEADLDRTGGQIVWHEDYSEIFGSRERLVLALRSHWRTMVQAQVDCDYELDGTPSAQMCELVAAHPGLATIVRMPARRAVTATPSIRTALVGAA